MRRFGVSLLILTCAWLAPAWAEDATAKQQRADKLFQEGRALLEANQYAQACDKFNEAIKLDPDAPGTLLNLGLCNEKLGKYATALFWFRKAQFRASETGYKDHEAAAKQHTAELAGKVATITIAFTNPPPRGIRVKIDDREVSEADFLRAEVDPGPHVLRAGAPGYKIVEHQFDVKGKGGDTITLTMVEGDNAIVVDRGRGRRRAAVITAVIGGAALVTGSTLAIFAKVQYDKCAANGMVIEENVDGKCPKPDSRSAAEYANKMSALARYGGTVPVAAGALAVGIASYIYFTAPAKERIDQTVFVPVLAPDEIGFAVTGRF